MQAAAAPSYTIRWAGLALVIVDTRYLFMRQRYRICNIECTGDMAADQLILFENDTILDNIQWKPNKLQIMSIWSSNQTKSEKKILFKCIINVWKKFWLKYSTLKYRYRYWAVELQPAPPFMHLTYSTVQSFRIFNSDKFEGFELK